MPRAELEHELEQLHPASFAWALQCCRRNRDDAEEVLQNTYVTVLDGASFDGRSSLKTWLFAVIRHTALSHRRTRWIRSLALLRMPSPEPVRDDYERSEETARLIAALRRLARRQSLSEPHQRSLDHLERDHPREDDDGQYAPPRHPEDQKGVRQWSVKGIQAVAGATFLRALKYELLVLAGVISNFCDH